ncbi:Hypothetical predicted protein [Paramuricea clavata]|uniref:Uncharacterized protein n=1 Tax=Paramuricea clavata TaxID=317549 RepID=A0A6S7IPA1_PARCT|nr:Hypothetical predicted protein [Paramuricea clavata]
MVWSEQRDVTFLREVAAEGLFAKKEKSRERGSGWQTVANNLNPIFDTELTPRSVKDHYNSLSKKHRARLAREMRATGEGGDELTEREELLEELMQIEEETDLHMEEENIARKEVIEMEKAKGTEMRERAMECLGESRKRLAEQLGKEKEAKKTRKTSGEVFEWLGKRMELETENKEKERMERKEEREFQREQVQQQQDQQQQQFAMLQHQMVALMQQQHQQTQLMFELIRKNQE